MLLEMVSEVTPIQVIYFTERESRGDFVKSLDKSGYHRLITSLTAKDFKQSDIAISFTLDELCDNIRVENSKNLTIHKGLDIMFNELNFGDTVVCFRINLTMQDCLGIYLGDGKVLTLLGVRTPSSILKVDLSPKLQKFLPQLRDVLESYLLGYKGVEEPRVGQVTQINNVNSAYVYLGKFTKGDTVGAYYIYIRLNMKRGICTNTLELIDPEAIWANLTRVIYDNLLGGLTAKKEPNNYTSLLGYIDLSAVPDRIEIRKKGTLVRVK